MLKRLFLLSALFGAVCVFGDAISIGHTRNGYPLIVPQVQKLAPESGSFTLPEKLTVAAPEALGLDPLARHYGETVTGGTIERSEADALCRFELTTQNVPKSPEGYTLAITPSGISVKARDVRGLYYGMQTLNLMLRHRSDAKELKCCTITDWPDLQMRGLFLHLSQATSDQIDRLCHVIDAFGLLKYNTLLIHFTDNFPYQDSPFTKRKTTLSRADIEKILAAAKRNHMEVVPAFSLVKSWPIKNHRDWPKFQEGKSGTYCLSDPEVQLLIEKMVREVADLIKPRHIHLGMDEIEQAGFPKCPKCKAADREKLLLAHLRPIKKILTERGIKPIIYQDQFFGFGETQPQLGIGIEKFPEKFGRDTVIDSWEYGPSPTAWLAKAIRRRGFKNLRYMSFGIDINNAQNLPKLAHKVGAQGVTLAYWGMLPITFDGIWGACRTLYPSFIAHSNYCWNAKDAAFVQLPLDGGTLFQELLDGTPERTFKGTASPVALGEAFNQCFSNDPIFPSFDETTAQQMRQIAADDPAKFDLRIQDGAPLAVVLSGGDNDGFAQMPVTIPVKTTASGASFLVTAARFNNFVFPRNQNAVSKTIEIGQFEVFYADDSTATIPLSLRLNINDWNTYLGGALCRAVVRGNDRNGALFSLYAIDWRNPHPDKEIKEIVFSSKGDTGVSPILFAVSLSDAAQAPEGVAGTPPSSFAKPERPAAQKTAALDFSGTKPVIALSEFGMKGLSCGVVNDQERGNVLEIRIPRTRKFLSRAVIDIGAPKAPPLSFESVVFDVRVAGWNGIYRPDFYLMKDGYNYFGAANFALEMDDKWSTVCIPLKSFSPTGKISMDALKIFSIRFFMLDGERPCTVRVGNIYYCDQVLPYRNNITIRVK
jgi:hypothetical protein